MPSKPKTSYPYRRLHLERQSRLRSGEWPCIESTIDCYIDGYKVRLWLDRMDLPKTYRREQAYLKRIFALGESFKGKLGVYEIIRAIIDETPKEVVLNAIQVQDTVFGTVVYTRDFVDEVHG